MRVEYAEAIREAVETADTATEMGCELTPEEAVELASDVCLRLSEAMEKTEPTAVNSIAELKRTGHLLGVYSH